MYSTEHTYYVHVYVHTQCTCIQTCACNSCKTPLSLLAYPVITHTPPVASNLSVKTLVARQWPTCNIMHAYVCVIQWNLHNTDTIGIPPNCPCLEVSLV